MGKIEKTGIDLKEHDMFQIKEPHHYVVIMFNDDFTSMDFVITVLVTVFHKAPQEAYDLMMKVHQSGQAIVGKYTYDIAASKRLKAMTMAKEAGYPFRIEMKEE